MSKRKIKRNMEKQNIHYGDNTTYNTEIKKLAIIIGVILVIFVLIYLIIGIFVTKEITFGNNDSEVSEETTIQYSKILAGETFNQNASEYYVIFSDSDSVNYYTYELVQYNNSDKNIYIVDMGNPLNEKYKSEESNKEVNSASDLKINGDTMIKVSNKQNVMYVEGVNEILNQFK